MADWLIGGCRLGGGRGRGSALRFTIHDSRFTGGGALRHLRGGLGGGLFLEGFEAEGAFGVGVGEGGELGVGVVVLPAAFLFFEGGDGACHAFFVLGAFEAVFLDEGVSGGEVTGLLAGGGLEAAEVEVDLADLLGGELGLDGHGEDEGVVVAEEVELVEAVLADAPGVGLAEGAGHNGGVVGAEAVFEDGAGDGGLDVLVPALGALAGGVGDGGLAGDGGGGLGVHARAVHGQRVEVLGGELGDVEGVAALAAGEEALGLGGGAVDLGAAEEVDEVLVGALLVEDVVVGVEGAGHVERPAILHADDVGGDGGEVVAAGEVEAMAAGDDLEAAVKFLEEQDGFGGDGLELALERLALDDAGAGVGLGLELLDVAVDLDLVEGDVVDADVGVAQQVVEGEGGGGAAALAPGGLEGGGLGRPCRGVGREAEEVALGRRFLRFTMAVEGSPFGLTHDWRFTGGGRGRLRRGGGEEVALGVDDGAVGHEEGLGVGAPEGAVAEADVAGWVGAGDVGPGGRGCARGSLEVWKFGGLGRP